MGKREKREPCRSMEQIFSDSSLGVKVGQIFPGSTSTSSSCFVLNVDVVVVEIGWYSGVVGSDVDLCGRKYSSTVASWNACRCVYLLNILFMMKVSLWYFCADYATSAKNMRRCL